MKHLKENNMGYWQHWYIAMSSSIALFVHAWFPNLLKYYASNKICPKRNEKSKIHK